MKIRDRISNWLGNPKNVFPNSKHVIKYAFTSGGVKYYQFHDVFNVPWKRGMEMSHAYEELNMRCDKEYLFEHAKFVKGLLTGPKFGMGEAMRILKATEQLEQRLNWVVVPEQAYKLASIVFFDGSENPDVYDIAYNLEKIKKWKEAEDVETFFLRQPVRTLMPFLEDFEGNFQTYSEIIEKVDRSHWKNLYTKFLENSATQLKGKQ